DRKIDETDRGYAVDEGSGGKCCNLGHGVREKAERSVSEVQANVRKYGIRRVVEYNVDRDVYITGRIHESKALVYVGYVDRVVVPRINREGVVGHLGVDRHGGRRARVGGFGQLVRN